MDLKVLLIVVSIGGIYGKFCGEPPICECYENLGLVTCKGIDVFPKFNRSEIWNIDMLDIKNTSLTKLPDLKDWTNLAMLTSVKNPFLDCEQLMQKKYPFHVSSDCPKIPKQGVKVKEDPLWAYIFTIIPVLMAALLGGYKAAHEFRRRNSAKKSKGEPVGGADIYERENLK